MTLYLITGPAGVGKSTISKNIAERLSKSVLIEGDDIYHLVVGSYECAWKEGNHLDYFWDNCLDLMKNSLKYGYDVVFNYILSMEDLKRVKENFKNVTIKFVCLLCDENTLIARDKLRDEDCQMGERCLILLNNFINKNFDRKFILNTNKTIDEEVDEILNNERFIVD